MRFLIDTNLPIDTDDAVIAHALRGLDITIEGSTDLPMISRQVAAREPDIVYLPLADWHRRLRAGDRHYRGLVMPTSKFTGTTDFPSVLVVRKDDPARDILDLEGATCGYINKSCTSSYFPLAILLSQQGRQFDEFLDLCPVSPWQGQIDAVISGETRATMVAEDVWRTTPANAETTRIIATCPARPAVIVARSDLDRQTRETLIDALVQWVPEWSSVFGCFKPFLQAEVHGFFHELDKLPADT